VTLFDDFILSMSDDQEDMDEALDSLLDVLADDGDYLDVMDSGDVVSLDELAEQEYADNDGCWD